MFRVVVAVVLLAGCNEHGSAPGDGSGGDPGPIDAPSIGSETCPRVGCSSGACVANCYAPGTDNCPDRCHAACAPSCAGSDCGPGKACIVTCNYDCGGMPWFCSRTCVAETSPAQCEAIHDEAACLARTDCVAIYEGSGCFCPAVTCSCTNPTARFDRCRPQ